MISVEVWSATLKASMADEYERLHSPLPAANLGHLQRSDYSFIAIARDQLRLTMTVQRESSSSLPLPEPESEDMLEGRTQIDACFEQGWQRLAMVFLYRKEII